MTVNVLEVVWDVVDQPLGGVEVGRGFKKRKKVDLCLSFVGAQPSIVWWDRDYFGRALGTGSLCSQLALLFTGSYRIAKVDFAGDAQDQKLLSQGWCLLEVTGTDYSGNR